MKTFHPTRNQFRQMFRPKLPSPVQFMKNQLALNKLNSSSNENEKPVVHTQQREGVYYQLHEEIKPTKRLMGFREWCEKH